MSTTKVGYVARDAVVTISAIPAADGTGTPVPITTMRFSECEFEFMFDTADTSAARDSYKCNKFVKGDWKARLSAPVAVGASGFKTPELVSPFVSTNICASISATVNGVAATYLGTVTNAKHFIKNPQTNSLEVASLGDDYMPAYA